MSRVRLLQSPEDFFSTIQVKTGFTFVKLGKICKVHRRNFSDWKTGRFLMPQVVFEKLTKIAKIKIPPHEILPDYWHNKEAGCKGALRRVELYGPPGTPEGRRKGGKISAQRFKENPNLAKRRGFILRKKINVPKKSCDLAECIGIILGDGTIAKMQVVVTLHRYDDRDFSFYVQKLFHVLFNINPSWVERKDENVINILMSSIALIDFLLRNGMQKGNKVKKQVSVPQWILRNKKFRAACLRGLFDTDGCFYIDKHIIKGKMYFNCAMNFTNRSLPLLNFFKEELERRGYHPTHNSRWSIFLRREEEISSYFREMGSSNNKHIKKYKKFFEEKYGGVA